MPYPYTLTERILEENKQFVAEKVGSYLTWLTLIDTYTMSPKTMLMRNCDRTNRRMLDALYEHFSVNTSDPHFVVPELKPPAYERLTEYHTPNEEITFTEQFRRDGNTLSFCVRFDKLQPGDFKPALHQT